MSTYDEYMYSGNQNYYADKARVDHMLTHGRMTADDYMYAGYHNAQNRVMEDSALIERFKNDQS